MKRLMRGVLPVLALLQATAFLTATNVYAQSTYPESLLSQKRTFSRGAAEAMGQPFRGIATPEGIQEGLFPLRSTGLSSAPLVEAAAAFLSTLSNAQLSRTQFAVDDPEWRNWSNVDVGIFARHGVSLEEMTAAQKDAAWNLLRVSLSTRGLQTTQNIMKTEQTLLELNHEPIRYGEEKYYFTVMGTPSTTEPWGWQLDGHHLVINYFVMEGQVVMTPTFLGGEPVNARSGLYEGNTILQEEQNSGLVFMQSLDPRQRRQAIIKNEKVRNEPMAAANEDNMTIAYTGLSGADMSGAQKLQLLELIRLYVGAMPDQHASRKMDEVAQHLNQTYFAWVGSAEDDAVFYYRIHSPVLLVEFDHQNPVGTTMFNERGKPTRDHIHIVVRTPNGNDYGKDLLRQHLATHPH